MLDINYYQYDGILGTYNVLILLYTFFLYWSMNSKALLFNVHESFGLIQTLISMCKVRMFFDQVCEILRL